MEGNRLYRSKTDQVLGGVCGGLADYLKLDSTLIRLLFVLLGLGSGVGLVLYVVLWVVVPYEGAGAAGDGETIRSGADELGQRTREIGADLERNLRQPNQKTLAVIGGGLILFGVFELLRSLDLPWLRWLHFGMIWPLALVILGVALTWRFITRK